MPLAETVDAFARLQQARQVHSWGVSNRDTSVVEELGTLPGGREVQISASPRTGSRAAPGTCRVESGQRI